jgi:hypothetical protein
MFENCLVHLRRTIEMLEPNIIVAQGWSEGGWSPSRMVAAALGIAKPAKNSCTAVSAAHGPVGVVSAVHPARNWVTPNMPAWRDVEAALREARSIALG